MPAPIAREQHPKNHCVSVLWSSLHIEMFLQASLKLLKMCKKSRKIWRRKMAKAHLNIVVIPKARIFFKLKIHISGILAQIAELLLVLLEQSRTSWHACCHAPHVTWTRTTTSCTSSTSSTSSTKRSIPPGLESSAWCFLEFSSCCCNKNSRKKLLCCSCCCCGFFVLFGCSSFVRWSCCCLWQAAAVYTLCITEIWSAGRRSHGLLPHAPSSSKTARQSSSNCTVAKCTCAPSVFPTPWENGYVWKDFISLHQAARKEESKSV